MHDILHKVLAQHPNLEFAVLVGSRATGTDHAESDWDIALQWHPSQEWLAVLGETEQLRHQLAELLGIPAFKVDLIDVRSANLAMRTIMAEEGIPLLGGDTPAWARFLRRTWRELEQYEWEKSHAA